MKYKAITAAPNQTQLDWTQEIEGVPLYHVAVKIYAECGTWTSAVVILKERHGIRTYPENMRAAVQRWLSPSDVMLDRDRPNSHQLMAWFSEFLDIHDIELKEWFDFVVERIELLR